MTEHTFIQLVIWASSIMVLGSISTAIICSFLNRRNTPHYCGACHKLIKAVENEKKTE